MLKILSNINSDIVIEDNDNKYDYTYGYSSSSVLGSTFDTSENESIYGSAYPNEWMRSHKSDYLKYKYRGYISQYFTTNYYKEYCCVHFYEYSSVDGNQRVFNSYKEFLDFCKESNINIDTDMKKVISNSYVCYITCYPGKSELMFSTTYRGLKNSLEKYNAAHSLSVSKSENNNNA